MSSDRTKGYLASFRPAAFSFAGASVPPALTRLWEHLASDDVRSALIESRRLLREKSVRNRSALAGLLVGAAAAELRSGNAQEATRYARRSLSILPEQWMAHGIRIAACEALQSADRAYRYASTLEPVQRVAPWDEHPDAVDFQVLVASLAWRVGAWDDVAARLRRAYPAGVASMPEALQADWFRLAFYCDSPEEAAGAARAILPGCTIEQLDALLNAMVQHGWTSEALPLYRDAFARHGSSQLLRRRLVGLCIREGAMEEARELASAGALNIVV